MKVLLTGAFGRLGQMVIETLQAEGIDLRCTDIPSPANRKVAAQYPGLDTAWLDIRDTHALAQQLQDIDAVIHLAALLPPATDTLPELAEAINVTATQQLIAVMADSPRNPFLVYTSSLTVFGPDADPTRLRTVEDPVIASDNYTRHKIAVEQMLVESSLDWAVLRIGVSVDARTLSAESSVLKQMLAVRGDNRLEYVHPRDVALALVRAVQRREAVNRKILLIGGGASCQITQAAFLGAAIRATGLRWQADYHGNQPYYTHWLDTTESQALLNFQQHGFDSYEREMRERLRFVRHVLWPLRWLINPLLAALVRRLNA